MPLEQTYRQAKQELGWADFEVRSDVAIRRHWTLVNCAFTLGWLDHDPPQPDHPSAPDDTTTTTPPQRPRQTWPEALRHIRACLAPLHMLQRAWHAWTTEPMPYELAELVNALKGEQRLYLYAPP